MDWDKLKRDRCPKDGANLVRATAGYECSFYDHHYREKCKFFITHKRREEIMENFKKGKKHP